MEEKIKKEIKITPIKNGTVIDHIAAGQALIVLKILGIEAGTNMIVSLVMNVQSQKLGKKDIVMIEDRELNEEETNKIALIAPQATINIIRNSRVVKKEKVHLPRIIEEILECQNPNCISNDEREPIKSKFVLENQKPISIKCYYCGMIIESIPKAIKY
jgi:aspartate carbamoyltransferase regulatory subunit